jgi:hypothetical protein
LNRNTPGWYFLTPDFLYRKVRYEYTHVDTFEESGPPVGRLFGKASIQHLPREIRYLLFNKHYRDFDLVNAHPVILLELAKILNIETPALESYVSDRKSYLESIEGSDRSRKKTRILINLNLTEGRWDTDPKISVIGQEVFVIRNALWEKMINRDPDYQIYYEKFIDKLERLKKKNIEIDYEAIKVSLQAWYCQTQESKHVLSLIHYLQEKHKEYLKDDIYEKKLLFDRKVDFKTLDQISLVPFFDGLFVYSRKKKFMSDLTTLLETYNRDVSKNGFSFEEKLMQEEEEKLISPEKIDI